MQGSDDLDAPSEHDAAAIDQDEEMEDLFGNTEERAASAAPSAQDSERLPSPERERRQALEYDEDEEPGQIAVVVREANVAFPNIPVPKTSDGENWVLRTPNYVRVDTRPFHHETYVGPEEEESQQGESLREKSMTIKLNVENTLRWRWVKDQHGNDRKESNARVVRWSDGSLSLRLGKELFDISQNVDAAPPRPQQSQSDASAAKPQGLTYLVAQHRRAQVLQVETSVTGYMSLQPTGMQSETHRMLVRSVGQKHNKVARLRMVAEPTVDPERQLQEMMKAEAKRSKKRTSDISGKQRRSRRSRVKADIWSDEDDDGAAYPHSDEDEETRSSPERRRKRRHTEVQDEENRGGGNYQEDDFVVADTSDDDHRDGRRRKKRDEEMEEDPLDRLDSKIEEQENKRRNQRSENTDDRMDVESEGEEDDEVRVRRSGPSGRRKRAIDFEDEEDE